jgi:hypothetical protein
MDQSGVTMTATTLATVNGNDFVNCHVFGNGLHGFNMTNNLSVDTDWLNCNIAGNGQTGISMFNGAQNFSIIGCRIGAYGEFGNNATGGINLGASCTYYRITDNDLNNGGISPLYGAGVQGGTNPGVNEFIYGNVGYVAQNRGQATITAGQIAPPVSIWSKRNAWIIVPAHVLSDRGFSASFGSAANAFAVAPRSSSTPSGTVSTRRPSSTDTSRHVAVRTSRRGVG